MQNKITVKRKFNVKDTILVSKICSKCSFSALDLIKIMSVGAEKSQQTTSMFLSATIMEKIIKELHLFHEELFQLISNITCEDVETIENLDFEALKDIFNQIKEKNNLESFLNGAAILKKNE